MSKFDKDYQPCNRHQQLRRELWNSVYVEWLRQLSEKSFNGFRKAPEDKADEALALFDKRFKHP